MNTATEPTSLTDQPLVESPRPIERGERALVVSAIYCLSEQARKLSLLDGGDGRALQQLRVTVPTTRLHLVTVDAEGTARLKLRPRYELGQDEQVARIDAPPIFDTPPDLEMLFQHAARNHQLERTYESQRHAARARRRDTNHEQRDQLAQAFLSDPQQRAMAHPAPSLKRCHLATDRGRVLFDVNTDQGRAREVPPEAHRRFRADLRTRAERNQQERLAQLAVHEEKKRQVAEWVAAHATPEQQSRQAAGMLPMDEAIEAMTDRAFAPLRDWPPYLHDGAHHLELQLRRLPQYANVVVDRSEVAITSTNAAKSSADQWAQLEAARNALPAATVTLRMHTVSWTRDRSAPRAIQFGILVTQKIGMLTLRREYAFRGDLG